MDSVFGLVGEGYAIIAADGSAARSILVFQNDQDKITQLDSHKLLAGSGVAADIANFTEYIEKNMKLYELNNDMKLSTSASANYIRGELAKALRRGPYQANILLAGFDEPNEINLYFLDYMAALAKVDYGAHGYAANFILSIFDRDWKKGLTLQEGLEIVKKCIHELHTRFLISQPNFTIKVVDKTGIREVTL